MISLQPFLLVLIAAMLTSCSTQRTVQQPLPIGSTDRGLPRLLPDSLQREPGRIDLHGTITLRQAIGAALATSPDLRAGSWEVRAAQARSVQASLGPNPEAGFEIEDFAGTGLYNAFDQTQATLRISQVFDLAGRRRRGVDAALLGEEVALWRLEAHRVDVAVEVSRRYVDVVAAERRIALAEEAVGLAERTREVVAERVQNGKVAGAEETKARIASTNSRIERDRARADLLLAQRRLAAMWGATTTTFTAVTGSIDSIPTLPSLSSLTERIGHYPALVARSVELAHRRLLLDFERAAGGIDLTLGGGVRYYTATRDIGVVAGISLPIPFVNRNQGNIEEAEARIQQAGSEWTADSLRLVALIIENYARVVRARDESIAIREEVLPDAIAVFESVRDGYSIGRFGIIDVLDAQRTLAQTQGRLVATLEAFHRALADLDALTTIVTIVQESNDQTP